MKRKMKICRFPIKTKAHWIASGLILLLLLSFYLNLSAWAALTITSPTSATFGASAVSTGDQSTTSTIAGVEVTNDDTVGWNATMNSTNFTRIGPVYTLAGLNNTLTTGGAYDGTYGVTASVVRYDVKIVTAGGLGAAEYQWRHDDSDWSSSATTGSGLALEKGITITFGSVTYVIDDEWQFGVDVLPYTSLTVTPGDITIVSGDDGVSKGASEILTGSGATSTEKTLMIGAAASSTGTYRQDEGLQLLIHGNSLFGEFSAMTTLTVL
jgi:hypothetical protein